MFPPAGTGSGLSLLLTCRSAPATGVVSAAEVLLLWSGSVVVVVALAVLLIVVPSGVAGSTLTTSVTVGAAPAPMLGVVAVIVPVPPTGTLSVRVQVPGTVTETRVVFAGSVSETLTLAASTPLLVVFGLL